MNDSIYKKIKSLPPLDDTVIQVQRICSDENSSVNDLTKVIEKDPMLTANILRSANSPLYGFSKEITTIARAISLFGMATVRGFALASAVKKNFSINLEPYNISTHNFLNISIAQTALMYNWYSKIHPQALEILSPASFMLEIGKLVLAHELIETHKDAEFGSKIKLLSNPDELSELELDMMGITNEEVTAEIFEQWNLESELVNTILHANDPEGAPDNVLEYARAVKVVKTAINLFAKLSKTSIDEALALLDRYKFDRDTFLMVATKVKDNL